MGTVIGAGAALQSIIGSGLVLRFFFFLYFVFCFISGSLFVALTLSPLTSRALLSNRHSMNIRVRFWRNVSRSSRFRYGTASYGTVIARYVGAQHAK